MIIKSAKKTKHSIELGQRLQQCREAKDYTQQEIADLVGIEQQTYSRYETGIVENPNGLILENISKLFETTPEWLKFEAGTPPPYLSLKVIPEGKVPLITQWEAVPTWIKSYDLDELTKTLQKKHKGKSDTNKAVVFLDFIGMMSNKRSKKRFALKIHGDSMVSPIPGKRSFIEGEIIIVDPDETPVNLSYVLALQNDSEEPMFTQYIIYGTNKMLRPLNPQFPLTTIDDSIKICGVVIAHLDVLV